MRDKRPAPTYFFRQTIVGGGVYDVPPVVAYRAVLKPGPYATANIPTNFSVPSEQTIPAAYVCRLT